MSVRGSFFHNFEIDGWDVVDVAERLADGLSTSAECATAQARATALEAQASDTDGCIALSVRATLYPDAQDAAELAFNNVVCFEHDAFSRQESEAHVALVREVFGNPFRPIDIAPWRTDTAVSLAKQMYEAREFGAMSILADALQDAGCDNDEVLNHCRDAKPAHVRGCWVVDGVLGKE